MTDRRLKSLLASKSLLESTAKQWLKSMSGSPNVHIDLSEPLEGSERRGRRWQLEQTKEALRAVFPDGVSPNLSDKEVQRRIEPYFKKNSWKLCSITTIARARGRGKRP